MLACGCEAETPSLEGKGNLMSFEKTELKARIEAKRKELEAQIAKLKADSLGGANDALGKLQTKLSSLEENLQTGWDNLTEAAAGKLNRWLADKD